jgi:outer membrane protein TolC
MRRLMLAAALTAATATALRAQEMRRVTLAEALDLALASQPAIVQARQDVRIYSAQERQALGAYIPSLSFSGNTNKSSSTRIDATTGQPVTVASPYNSTFGLSASWDVFTGLRRGAAKNQAEANLEARDATLLRQEYAIALSTKQAFFQALAAAELVTVQSTRLRRADEQLKLTAERLRLGATTRSDSLRARVEYGNAQLALISAQNDLRTAQANLGRAIQVPGLAMAVFDSSLGIRLAGLDTAQLYRDARANAPTIREAEASLSAARAGKSVARAPYMPTISLGGGYNIAAAAEVPFTGVYQPSWNVRLSISYPLFNNFQRETNRVTADANAQSAEARLRDARLALDASLTQRLSDLEAAAARIDVSQVSVAAAEEDLRMQRERYRLGAVTIIEVLASQANLDQAQVDFVRARYDYLVARAQIEALVGHAL